jgi:HAD superfamily hydrolase (TIGR01549 family)
MMTRGPSSLPERPRIAAVLFDMDGTLTQPQLDFDAIRAEIGLPTTPRTPILESLERMTPEDRERAEAILHHHEETASAESVLQTGAVELLDALRRCAVPVGLITRNSRRSAGAFLERHDLVFDAVRAREDGPVKPSPEPILDICKAIRAAPHQTWFVGDYLFDLQAGRAAGTTTVLILNNEPAPDYADQADHTIKQLDELIALLSLER